MDRLEAFLREQVAAHPRDLVEHAARELRGWAVILHGSGHRPAPPWLRCGTCESHGQGCVVGAPCQDEAGRHPEPRRITAQPLSLAQEEVRRGVTRLLEAGVLVERAGAGTGCERELLWRPVLEAEVRADLEEDVVWRKVVEPSLGEVPQNARDLLEYGFTEMFNNVLDHSEARRVVVVVRDLHPGEQLVSRSQAKRLLARCEQFDEITLDFTGIESIGPAFADEAFRVIPSRHPELVLREAGANEEVQARIRQVRE